MKFRVSILPQARRDIERNAEWWASRHSADQALRWSVAVYEQIEGFADAPEIHAFSIENSDFSYEIREKRVGLGARPRYRAIFTIKEDTVFVLAVRAAEQDRITPDELEFGH